MRQKTWVKVVAILLAFLMLLPVIGFITAAFGGDEGSIAALLPL